MEFRDFTLAGNRYAEGTSSDERFHQSASVGRNKMRAAAGAAIILFVYGAFTAAHAADAAPPLLRAPTPNFSGIWAHLTFPDVEPPLNGPGPVRNRSRVTPEQARTMAPYNGAATSGPSPNGVSNLSELVGDFTNPILKPAVAEVVKQHGEISKQGIAYPTPSNQCWPGGVPFVFWNIGMAERVETACADH